MNRFALCFVIASAICMGVSVQANAQEVSATSRSTGMSDALTAGASGTAAIWNNPAGIASAIMYSAEAVYAYDWRTSASVITANAIDSKSNEYVAMGLSFSYETSSSDDFDDLEGLHFRGAIAVPLLDGMIKIGTNIRYSDVDFEGKDRDMEALLLDAGLIITPVEGLHIGVNGMNLVNGDYDDLAPMTVAVGLAYASIDYGFHFGGDLLFDLSQENPEDARIWRLGVEYLVADLIPLRGGFQHNEVLDQSSFSLGAGYLDPSAMIGVDLAYKHNLDDDADKVFTGSLSVYF